MFKMFNLKEDKKDVELEAIKSMTPSELDEFKALLTETRELMDRCIKEMERW